MPGPFQRNPFSGGVRTSGQKIGRWNSFWKVKVQSIQRSASARRFTSVGQSLPALCFAATSIRRLATFTVSPVAVMC